MLHRRVQVRLLVAAGCFVFGGAAGAVTVRLCSESTLLSAAGAAMSFVLHLQNPHCLLWSLLIPGLCAFLAGSLSGVVLLPVLDTAAGFFTVLLLASCLHTSGTFTAFVCTLLLALFLLAPCLLMLSADGLGMSLGIFRSLHSGGRLSFDFRPFTGGFFALSLLASVLTVIFLLLLKRQL